MNQSAKRPKFNLLLVVAIIIILAAASVVYVRYAVKSSYPEPTSEYQAVFLSNGQVYFGKMVYAGSWIALKDVYYLQVSEPLQSASSEQGAPSGTATPPPTQDVKLVKLGSELHGPQDAMYIDRGNVLFWENLKDDSKVLDAIKRYSGK